MFLFRWGITDNAENMCAIFRLDDCYVLYRIACLIHTLQLCMKHQVLSMKGPAALVDKVKDISTHALNAQQCPCYALYAMFSTVSFVG